MTHFTGACTEQPAGIIILIEMTQRHGWSHVISVAAGMFSGPAILLSRVDHRTDQNRILAVHAISLIKLGVARPVQTMVNATGAIFWLRSHEGLLLEQFRLLYLRQRTYMSAGCQDR